MEIRRERIVGSLADTLRGAPRRNARLYWLGQAGFVLRLPDNKIVLVDPYLSDFLAEERRGKTFDYVRLMQPPITVFELPRVDVVLCTHRHGDHMDPWTLTEIAMRFPNCPFVVPAPEVSRAVEIGLAEDRVKPAFVDRVMQPIPGVSVHPLPAAHDALDVDANGASRFLGYVVTVAGVSLYHSGDCLRYPGQASKLAELKPGLALLPVNGRDAYRANNGVGGNFTWDEAVALCQAADISWLVPHHFGMFAFNTVDQVVLDVDGAAQRGVAAILPEPGTGYELVP